MSERMVTVGEAVWRDHPSVPGARVLVARAGQRMPEARLRQIGGMPMVGPVRATMDPQMVVQAGEPPVADEGDVVDAEDYSTWRLPRLRAEAAERGIGDAETLRKQDLVGMLEYDDESRGR